MKYYNVRVEEDYFGIYAEDEDEARDAGIEEYIQCHADEWVVEIEIIEDDEDD